MAFVPAAGAAARAGSRRAQSICRMVEEFETADRVPYSFCAGASSDVALLLVHPIGVGLSKSYWNRFMKSYDRSLPPVDAFAPDLKGCGGRSKPAQKVTIESIAEDLAGIVENTIKKPVIIYSEGALAGAAFELASRLEKNLVKGVVMGTPPPLDFFSKGINPLASRLAWLFFSSPLGIPLFYYVRRREFLRKFTEKNLFYGKADDEWLTDLEMDAQDITGRWAVYSFLAGEWRKDFRPLMKNIECPSLLLMGEKSLVISRSSDQDTVEGRIRDYARQIPNLDSKILSGCNVLAWEYAEETADAVIPFIKKASRVFQTQQI
mmetsp:Transcript_10949/g.33577  ORF Transcript_10949/g.33577 Transcript_10949/m.33577 type:complete len:321 (-) Transcript_10949:1911-2873(-)